MTPAQFAAMRKLKAEAARQNKTGIRPAAKPKRVPHKFNECGQCIFYCASRVNAACLDCDAGENFEERIEELRPGRDATFRKREHDDFE